MAKVQKKKSPKSKKIIHRKRSALPFILLGFVAAVVSGIILLTLVGKSSWLLNSTAGTPEIVMHFACSGNCPGDASQYMVQIYNGVTDSQECLRLGGQPFTYKGWETTTVCKVK